MSTDPYTPPQSKYVTAPTLGKSTDAYRDGDDLMVPPGYFAPRICFLSGVEVGDRVAAKPLKFLPPWVLKLRPMLGIAHTLLLIVVMLWLRFDDDRGPWEGLVVASLIIAVLFSTNSRPNQCQLYYEENAYKSVHSPPFLQHLPGLILLVTLTQFSSKTSISDTTYTVAAILIIIVMTIADHRYKARQPTRIISYENGLYRLRGAHENLLSQYADYEANNTSES